MISGQIFRWGRSLFVVLVAGALLFVFSAVTWAFRPDTSMMKKVDAALADKMATAGAKQTFDVIIKLAPAGDGRPSAPNSTLSKAKSVALLKTRTERAQQGLARQIKTARVSGEIKATRRFWITNAIEVKATAAAIKSLAARPEVKAVFPNFRVGMLDPAPTPKSARSGGPGYTPSAGNEWNINKIDAPGVWSTLSTTGTGAKIAILDTGIDATHPDLVGKVDEFVEVDESGNATSATPHDTDQHGTHVSGTIAGGSAGGTAIGVAPGARLMGAIVLPEGWGTYAQVMGGMEWAADPDGNPATPDQPDVVNMSLGGDELVPQMFEPVDNLVAAGVFPAMAIGNWGPGWTSSPADVPTAFAVGATDENDVVAWWSSGAEVTWYDPPHEGTFIKPDASAPGVAVKSSVPGGGYQVWSGTSMATPHVAGAAALLRSLDPSLTVDQLSGILQSTALDLGAADKDTRYGSGRIDAFAAATLASSFGTVEGTITALGETTGATIKIVSDPTGTVIAKATAGGNGRYAAEAPPGDYHVAVSKYGLTPTSSSTFTLAGGATHIFSVNMALAPRHKVSGRVTKTAGGASLEASITVVSPVNISTPTVGGAYSLSVPEGTYRIRAGAYGYKNKEATVTVGGGNVVQNFALDRVSPTLLVLDVGALTYADYFTNALDTMGASYDVLEIDWDSDEALPGSRAYTPYSRIVWAAGDGPVTGADPQYDPVTDQLTEPPLASYLDGGGKLFLTGQDAAYYMDWWGQERIHAKRLREQSLSFGGDFLGEYLHARLIADKAKNLTIAGKPNTLFAGRTMDLLGGDGADNQFWADVIGTDGVSVPELTYTRETTGAASLRTYSGKNDSGRVVYFGFGLEALDNAPDRTYAMSKALGWLGASAGTLSAKPSPATVTGIAPATVAGKLTPSVAGQSVTIEQKHVFYFPPGGGDEGMAGRFTALNGTGPGAFEPTVFWAPVVTARTVAGGNFSAVVAPMGNTTYRATWGGNAQYARTTSPEFNIKVAPLIFARAAKRYVSAGSRTHINGMIMPPPGGMIKMALLGRPIGNRRWRLVDSDISVWGGSFRIPVKPLRNTVYRLVSESGDLLQGARSKKIVVRTRHNITLRAETSLIQKDVPILFSGVVAPKHDAGNLKLQRLSNGAWTTVSVLALTGRGHYEIPYAGGEAGAYRFRVTLGRDDSHFAGSSKSVRVRFY